MPSFICRVAMAAIMGMFYRYAMAGSSTGAPEKTWAETGLYVEFCDGPLQSLEKEWTTWKRWHPHAPAQWQPSSRSSEEQTKSANSGRRTNFRRIIRQAMTVTGDRGAVVAA